MSTRYYNPEVGRFLNADEYPATGQGIVGNNMFAYCINNPTSYVDHDGKSSEAIQIWSASMWWLCAADAILPIGDAVYVVGIIVLSAVTAGKLASANSNQSSLPNIKITANSTPKAPQPNKNNQDDDDDDDYYNDDNNFGGRQKIGKNKGGTPGNNKAQNKQFKDATKGIPKAKQRQIHDLITKKQFGYQDIVEIAKWYK